MQYIARALKLLQMSWRYKFDKLSQVESLVLLVIASRPGILSADIQDELNLDQPHASRILKKLISKRFVRSLSFKPGDRTKIYFLTPQHGASRFLTWIDKVIDELLVQNPAMLGRFVAALEVAPEEVILNFEKAILRMRNRRAIDMQGGNDKTSHNLVVRNQSSHAYGKFFIGY